MAEEPHPVDVALAVNIITHVLRGADMNLVKLWLVALGNHVRDAAKVTGLLVHVDALAQKVSLSQDHIRILRLGLRPHITYPTETVT